MVSDLRTQTTFNGTNNNGKEHHQVLQIFILFIRNFRHVHFGSFFRARNLGKKKKEKLPAICLYYCQWQTNTPHGFIIIIKTILMGFSTVISSQFPLFGTADGGPHRPFCQSPSKLVVQFWFFMSTFYSFFSLNSLQRSTTLFILLPVQYCSCGFC